MGVHRFKGIVDACMALLDKLYAWTPALLIKQAYILYQLHGDHPRPGAKLSTIYPSINKKKICPK